MAVEPTPELLVHGSRSGTLGWHRLESSLWKGIVP